jgi:predicted aldo/keto reductase-like oxidoreductase
MSRKDESRRDFLKKGATGFAAVTLVPAALAAAEEEKKQQSEEKKEKRKIVERTLGKTGIKLPVVSMGARFGTPDQIKAALDEGIKHIDTANVYGRGQHEKAVGEAIKDRPRDSVVIGTKVYMPMDQKTGLYPKDLKAEKFVENFDAGLKRLGTDYVEILYLHDVVRRESALFEPFLTAMQKLKKEGKARFIGVSTHTNEPEVINAAVDAKVYDVALTAYNFKQPHLDDLEKAIDRAAKAGMGIVAMKTQAGVYWDRERQQKINMKAALKWALNNPHVHTSVPGFANFEEMEEALSVMEDLALTDQEKKDLKLDSESKRAGLFCSQCRDCVAQCTEDLDIPTLMRSYMYAYGYRDLAKAKDAVRHLDLTRIPCQDCGTCRVADCPMGFDVKEKVLDIARIERVPRDFLA